MAAALGVGAAEKGPYPFFARSASGFREGVAVNLLNPSIATFYMVVVPSFLPGPGLSARFLLLASIHVGLAFPCHTAWVTGFDVL